MDKNEALLALELSEEKIQGLSQEEQQALFRATFLFKSYSCLSLNNQEEDKAEQKQHAKLIEAYNTVKQYKVTLTDEFNGVVEDDLIDIPLTAFDLLQEEDIIKAYSELLAQYRGINSEVDKVAFIAKYGDFIKLARALEKNTQKIGAQRIKALDRIRYSEPLMSQFTREWRMLIIRLLGEEYLDDFSYRQALASGELWPILATRKLLSPVKLMVAVLNSALLMISTTKNFYGWKLLLAFLSQVDEQEKAYKNGVLSIHKWLLILAELVSFAALLGEFPLVLSPLILPDFLIVMLDKLGSPVNAIFKPIAKHTDFPVLGVGFVLSSAVLLAGCMLSAMALPSTVALLLCAQLLTLGMLTVLSSSYTETSFFAKFFSLLTWGITLALAVSHICLVIRFLMFPALPPIPGINWLVITTAFSLMNFSAIVYQLLYGFNDTMQELEVLPLPAEPVPEAIQKTAAKLSNTARISYRLFNTDSSKNAQNTQSRTCLQTVYGLFSSNVDKLESNDQVPVLNCQN